MLNIIYIDYPSIVDGKEIVPQLVLCYIVGAAYISFTEAAGKYIPLNCYQISNIIDPLVSPSNSSPYLLLFSYIAIIILKYSD